MSKPKRGETKPDPWKSTHGRIGQIPTRTVLERVNLVLKFPALPSPCSAAYKSCGQSYRTSPIPKYCFKLSSRLAGYCKITSNK